jgi:hypothetical protein
MEIEVVCRGDSFVVARWGLFLDGDEAIQTGKGYGSANDEVGKTEDCGVGTNSQRKSEDSHKSKAR